ncbi:thiamine-binding protein [Gracilinema caldarium]|uniref:thiamine-binding protein n=1 Tax=Gracilinema caldarium TaxID=215591 RepID=UPI0026E98B61|nr:thiamine-binding protein [Gracilinema caldarium]
MKIDVDAIPSAMAIQCLPMGLGTKEETYAVVDSVITLIQESGLSYEVGPFETVVEGPLPQLLDLAGRMHRRMLESGISTAASYIKLWSGTNMGSTEEKVGKYRK